MPTFSNYVSRSLTVGVSAFALFMTLSLTAAGEETAGWMYRQYPPTPAGGYTGGEFKRLYDNFMLPQVCPNGQVFFGFLGGPDAVNGSERGKPRCVSNFSLSGGIILESPTANVGKLYLGGAYDFSYDGGTDGNYVFSNLADANGKTTFRGNSLDILTVHNNGNVGIGTTAPSDKLTVVGAGNFGGQVSVDTLASRGEITAENGYDQRLYIGGDAAGNDFEIGSVTAAQSNLSFFNRATGTYMNIGAQNGTFLWMLNAQGGFITERRSGSDPASPVDGQMWLRTDVAPVSGSVTAGGGGGAGLSGGSTNYLARWNGSSSVGVSSIFDNGKIGIGTNQPGTLNGFNASYMAADHLDVEITGKARDTAFSDGTILLTSNRPTPTAGDRVGAIFFASKNNGNASSANNFGSAIAGQLVGAGGSNGFGSTLGFWTAPNSGASAQRMLIDSDGNVGIGAATIANRYVSGVNAARVLDIVGGSQHAGISILAGAGKNAFIDFRDPLNPNSVRANLFYDDTNSGTLFINPGLATNVSINPDAGNVGIGTTAPDSKLTVAGNVNATGLCINGDCRTSWPTGGGSGSGGAGWERIPAADTSAWSDSCQYRFKLIGSDLLYSATAVNATYAYYQSMNDHVWVASSNKARYHQQPQSGGGGTDGDVDYVEKNCGGSSGSGASLSGGSSNYLVKWNGSSSVGVSSVFDNGTNVGIGTATPSAKLHVEGSAYINGNLGVAGINANQLCLGGECKTSWPTYGATESCVMWRDVAPAQHTTCALRSDGTVWCWGNADDWRAGYGGNQNLNFAGMQQVVGLGSVKKIQSWAGELGSCALKEDGTLWCWGRNYYQRIATKHDDSRMYRPYRAMDDFFNTRGRITDFYAGYNDSCVVLEDGTLWCWGRNDQGQLGIGNTTRQSAPVQVTSLGNSVKSVAMGLHTTCALLTDGTVKCFGYDWQGQLGDNSATTSNKSTPVFVSFPTTTSPVVEIAGYSDDNQHGQFCARKQDGTVWCWGQSYYGSLWDGTDADKGRPVQVVGITNATSISVGQWACAGLANGGMKCWGDGNEGETGNNTKSPRINSTPVNVLISEVRSIGLGTDTRCAIRTDGRLLCWGYNNWYNAGNGTNDTADITEPEIVDGGLNYCVPEGAPAPACMDGIDNDGDGRMDDEDGGCWTTTVVGGKTEIDRSQQSNYNPLDQDESNGDIYPTRTLRDTGASPGTTLWNIAADGSINPDSITSGRYLNFARGGGNGYNGWCGSQRVNAQWDIKTGYLNYWNFAQNHSGCGNAVEYNYPVQMGGMYKQGGTQY